MDESRYQECVRVHAHAECVCVRGLICADSNLASVTFRCSEKKDFEMRVAFKNFSLAQTVSGIVKTVTHKWLFHLDGDPMAGLAVNLRSNLRTT